MKKLLLTLIATVFSVAAFACTACEKQQPELLKGISHGAGPQSTLDYAIVWATVILVLVTLFYSIKWVIKPGEKSDQHIKRTVLDF